MDNDIIYSVYILINKDLNMSAGKMAAQTAHVIACLTNKINQDKDIDSEMFKRFNEWISKCDRMIVLEASEVDILNLSDKFRNYIYYDRNGFISRDDDKLTAIAFYPMTREEYGSSFRKF